MDREDLYRGLSIDVTRVNESHPRLLNCESRWFRVGIMHHNRTSTHLADS